jgi:hypothetical protein
MSEYLSKEQSGQAIRTRICPLWRLAKSVQCNHRYDTIRGLAQHLSRVHGRRINYNRIPLKQLRNDSRTERRIRGANSRSAAVPPEIKHHPDCPAAYFGFKPGVTCTCDVNRSQA